MTHRACLWLASMLVCASAASVRAQDRTGFEGVLRVGYGIPFGKISASEGNLHNAIHQQLSLALELGWRVMPKLFMGLSGQYGFGIHAIRFDALCAISDDSNCSATDVRVSVEAQYHPMPGQKLDPWIGFGVGYEWFTLSLNDTGAEGSTTFSGFELAKLQGGLDVALTPYFRIGPFVSFSLSEFSDISISCSGPFNGCGAQQGSIASRSLHEWLLFGVRAALRP